MNFWENLSRDSLLSALQGARVAVVGLGVSGISVVNLLSRLKSKIFVSDCMRPVGFEIVEKNLIRYELGGHTRKILENDLIIVSPGVSWNMTVLSEARTKEIPVWGELELGYRLLQSKRIVAVTGTNGKTTTVSLLYDIFKRYFKRTLLAGNVGHPLCDYILSKTSYDAVVLEVSSYQLESIQKFHPQVSVILNLTPDHLVRHSTMSKYGKAKERIFNNQTNEDFAILNRDDPWVRKMGKNSHAKILWISKSPMNEGIFWDATLGQIAAKIGKRTLKFHPPKNLLGMHNIENCCAAIAASLALGVHPGQIEYSLRSFKGVPHRLEKVAKINGVKYINDSKGTNVDSTLKALESFQQPLWLILGGQDKGASYQPIRRFIEDPKSAAKVLGVSLIGEAARKIGNSLKGSASLFYDRTLSQAVANLRSRANRGEMVLLSPACASFDQFKNFEDRGNQFKDLVLKTK